MTSTVTTHVGTVTAASDWGAAAERKWVVPSRTDSYEGLMHATGIDRFMLPLRGGGSHVLALQEARLERAIGVIYRPKTERQSHYFFAQLPAQLKPTPPGCSHGNVADLRALHEASYLCVTPSISTLPLMLHSP